MDTLSIVIPAYNEEERLPRTLEVLTNELPDLARGGLQLTEVIVVDDGSSDQTGEKALSFSTVLPSVRVLSLKKNQGKGAAVKAGCLQATSSWILIADADMSTPWPEVLVLREKIGSSAMAMASRALPDSRISTRQPWLRERMGRIFNLLLRAIAGVPFRDTQCGFKLLNREKAAAAVSRLTIQRFAWDVELVVLLLRSRSGVQEIATAWEHRDESRVHMIRDSANMLWTVIKMKIRLAIRG